jgi:hypothetical protein
VDQLVAKEMQVEAFASYIGSQQKADRRPVPAEFLHRFLKINVFDT